MSVRGELLEAALDHFPDGVALLGLDRQILYWNRAAEETTGFSAVDLVPRSVPGPLDELLAESLAGHEVPSGRSRGLLGTLVQVRHRHGHPVSALVRCIVMRSDLGEHIGSAYFFHTAEGLDHLPHGDAGSDLSLESSQAEMEERLLAAFARFEDRAEPLGILWITVDQAHALRQSHGACACDDMLRKMHRSLRTTLRPGEEMGRWGQDEFLFLTHQPFASLAARAEQLAGLARTTDFRWWGDRLSLSVSIGAAQATPAEALPALLERARCAMTSSLHAGGNGFTIAPGRMQCSPS